VEDEHEEHEKEQAGTPNKTAIRTKERARKQPGTKIRKSRRSRGRQQYPKCASQIHEVSFHMIALHACVACLEHIRVTCTCKRHVSPARRTDALSDGKVGPRFLSCVLNIHRRRPGNIQTLCKPTATHVTHRVKVARDRFQPREPPNIELAIVGIDGPDVSDLLNARCVNG
jgi:hypothetical protein